MTDGVKQCVIVVSAKMIEETEDQSDRAMVETKPCLKDDKQSLNIKGK